jgi:hypothetical protein
MKSTFQQVMDAINNGEKFSWNFNGLTAFRNTDRLVHEIPNPTEASIGWILQEFCVKALYDADLLISFEPSPEGLKIYYK